MDWSYIYVYIYIYMCVYYIHIHGCRVQRTAGITIRGFGVDG